MTLRWTDDGVSPVPPHVIRAADAAYLAGATWRCPGRMAHSWKLDGRGHGVCIHCGRRR